MCPQTPYLFDLTKFVSCNLDEIMQRVEWITLMFFGAMFITMECLARLGLIKWIGSQTENFIMMVDEDLRLALAIFIILWVVLKYFPNFFFEEKKNIFWNPHAFVTKTLTIFRFQH